MTDPTTQPDPKTADEFPEFARGGVLPPTTETEADEPVGTTEQDGETYYLPAKAPERGTQMLFGKAYHWARRDPADRNSLTFVRGEDPRTADWDAFLAGVRG